MKQSKLFKTMALVLALALCLTVFCACGEKKQETVVKGEDAAKVALRVNDEIVTMGDMQFYLLNSGMRMYYEKHPDFDGDLSKIDWTEKTESGKTLEEAAMELAIQSAVSDTVMKKKGEENGIKFTEEESKQLDQQIAAGKEQYGEEYFNLNIQAMGIVDEGEYRRTYERVTLAQRTSEQLATKIDEFAPDKEKLKEYKNDNKVTVKHVLILSKSNKFSNPEQTANEVLQKAKSGESFEELIKKYNEDPGSTDENYSYTFGKGEMVSEFETASFALDIDQISEVVKTEYGFHVIKRYAGMAEVENMWISEAKIERNDSVLKTLSLSVLAKAANDAANKLEEMSAAMQGGGEQQVVTQTEASGAQQPAAGGKEGK